MPKVPFAKPAEKPSDLLARLAGRGAAIGEPSVAYRALSRIGYYRLSGYMIPFQTGHQPDPHRFKPGTTFEQFLALYELDRKLRLFLMDAIEPIEVAVRGALCNRLAMLHGAHWHTDPSHFSPANWPELERKVADALEFDLTLGTRKNTARTGTHLFLDHYYAKYSPPAQPPCWMLMEVASFGLAARLFKSLASAQDRKAVAQEFAYADRKPMDESLLTNWFHGLSVLRNRCAHHSRIVYKNHPFEPIAAKKPQVQHLFKGGQKLREFLVVAALLAKAIDPKSDWVRRLYFLLDATSNVDVAAAVGLSADWRKDPLWELAW